ncbi:LOW QUALITY PROTEIN: hypothetical protein ACHAW6_004300 [Cyclotella cf. meneghiniana]
MTGTCLTSIPDRFSGTELTQTEWLGNISIHTTVIYHTYPPAAKAAGLTTEHELNCKNSGLVCIHHDNAHDEWAQLCSLALSNARVVI